MKSMSTYTLFRNPLLLTIVMVIAGLGLSHTVRAETMMVSFAIQPSAVLDLVTPSLAFSAVNPGEVVEETVQVLVKSNVSWELRIKGNQSAETEDGSLVAIASRILVLDYLGAWEGLFESAQRILINQSPTNSQGTLVDVSLRLEGDFSDPPGTYGTEIEFTLVPQI